MKLILFSLLLMGNLLAEPVSVPRFLNYENVTFTEIIGDSVKFTHKNGIGRAKLSELPKSILEKLKGLDVKKEEATEPVVTQGEISGQAFSVKDDGVYIQSRGFKINGKLEPFPKMICVVFMDDTSMYSDGQEIKVKCYAVGNHKVGDLVMPRFSVRREHAIQFATPPPPLRED